LALKDSFASLVLLPNWAEDEDIGILVNNAGMYLSGDLVDLDPVKIREVISVNLMAPIFLTRAVWPILKKNSGLVVNINSLASIQGGPGESVYAASKAGLRGFTETLQFDATRDGIRLLNVNLGGLDTDMAGERKDRDKFINPSDAAMAIFNLCRDYRSLRITSIDLKRRIY
jgi:3-oxoacyl-[acyl-carrier protein] reductase